MHESLCFKSTLFLSDHYIDSQEIPFFANHSPWDSRYWRGRNFIAQSCTRSTLLSSRHSITSVRALSWLTSLSWCDFQSWIARVASWNLWRASSLSYWHSKQDSWIAFWVSDRTALRSSQRLHIRSWSWVQVPLKAGSLLSLSAYWLQWSDTREELETWTYCRSKIVSEQDYARPGYSGEYT